MVWTVNVVVKKSQASAAPPRPRRRTAVALVVTIAAALHSDAGCGWLRWRELARTHVDLLERMALDGADTIVARAEDLRAGDIERLRYPLSRAREFAQSSRRRFEGAAWLADFDALLGDYEALVDWLDKARTRRVGPRDRERARDLAERVRESAARVRETLDASDT